MHNSSSRENQKLQNSKLHNSCFTKVQQKLVMEDKTQLMLDVIQSSVVLIDDTTVLLLPVPYKSCCNYAEIGSCDWNKTGKIQKLEGFGENSEFL